MMSALARQRGSGTSVPLRTRFVVQICNTDCSGTNRIADVPFAEAGCFQHTTGTPTTRGQTTMSTVAAASVKGGANITPSSGDVLLMVGTTKGVFLLHSNTKRQAWTVTGPHLGGEGVNAICFDGRAGRTRIIAG